MASDHNVRVRFLPGAPGPVALPAGRQVNVRAIKSMYFVYILLSEKDHKYYTGMTNDLERRISQHNVGYSSTRSTKTRGPFKLVFAQECTNRVDARILERSLKSGSGRELRNELLKYTGLGR